MGVIVTLLPQPGRLQRLRAAIRDRHSIITCDDWGGVTRICETEPVHLAVLDLYADGPANFERVRVLKLRFPRVALIAYVSITLERARDMFDAGRCGLDGLVVADLDDAPAVLLMHIEKAEARSVASVVRPVIAGLKATVRDAVLASVTRAHERLTPEAFARLLAVPRRLLTRRLTEAGFPAPHRLLTWGRLIVAAHMLEDANRSADSVAQVLDFPSGSAFRNTCQRYLHSTPQQVRDNGGAAHVIAVFMREARSRATTPAAQDAGTSDHGTAVGSPAGLASPTPAPATPPPAPPPLATQSPSGGAQGPATAPNGQVGDPGSATAGAVLVRRPRTSQPGGAG